MDGLGVPFWPSALIGLATAVAVSMLLEVSVYEPVARRAADRAMLAVLVTSIGVSTAGIALLQLKFGTSSLPFYGPQPERFDLGSVRISSFDLAQVATCLILVAGLAAFLAFTPIGRSIKAVRSNPGLASVLGISVRRVGTSSASPPPGSSPARAHSGTGCSTPSSRPWATRRSSTDSWWRSSRGPARPRCVRYRWASGSG